MQEPVIIVHFPSLITRTNPVTEFSLLLRLSDREKLLRTKTSVVDLSENLKGSTQIHMFVL